MGRFIVLAALLGCTAGKSTTGVTDADEPSTETDTDTVPTPTEELRPPVQRGNPPNADWQSPAFDGQRRAPQPATDTAFEVESFATGLVRPWALEVMPDGRLIVTERPGRMRIIETDGTLGDPLSGLPGVVDSGQGGLLDVALPPDFATSKQVYWSYSEDRGSGENATAVARGTLSADETGLETVEVIFQQQPAWASSLHFGSRLVFADDGMLFVTLGERSSVSSRVFAQDPTTHLGAVIRIRPDGSAPDDNPTFDDDNALPELWSKGHRNPQSAALDAQGRLWTVEHGPRGGDELNMPVAGGNHGWPVVTYGEEYSGAKVGSGVTVQEGIEQPVYYWDPVIAPSGMRFYDGDLFEGWQGNILIGGLVAEALVRLTLVDDKVYTEEWLDLGTRVRDVAVAPDGAILVVEDTRQADVLRITPSPAE